MSVVLSLLCALELVGLGALVWLNEAMNSLSRDQVQAYGIPFTLVFLATLAVYMLTLVVSVVLGTCMRTALALRIGIPLVVGVLPPAVIVVFGA